ncbi:MAG: threonine synthase [Acidobacteriota bacterium]|nr:threonine synthase [Acidobacteriota bacterium]MDE2965379.1 threonine synthase [Acidobacteriota bacterium]
MSFVNGLQCRECDQSYPKEPLSVCEFCFGPLEVVYDYEAIRPRLSREIIGNRAPNMWRYAELLPLDGEARVGSQAGFTPLVRADNLAKRLGLKDVYIKNDSVCAPTLSFKDRVVAVALSKALEFGFDTVGCASTGNLANAVAANAASVGLNSYVFIPADLEMGKVLGTLIYKNNVIKIDGNYDDVNRLCSEIVGKYRWGFVNINLRPFYAEGSKSFGLEVAEQLGWRTPDCIVVPMAGGSLITKIRKAFTEMEKLDLIPDSRCRIFGAQATGCSPITTAVKTGRDFIKPVKPDSIAKSIAIGNPADGYYALKTMLESGGWGEDVSDEEVVEGIQLLAEEEGIFTETAGGVTVAVTRKLIGQGRIGSDDLTVISITGNGLKTQEAVQGRLAEPAVIPARLSEFEETLPKVSAVG